MNDELSSRNYVAGDSFSMADIDLLASLQFAGWAGKVKPDESLTALIDWRQRAQAVLD
jgi:glutathione S-transferase